MAFGHSDEPSHLRIQFASTPERFRRAAGIFA
jgi:hypothetical protein